MSKCMICGFDKKHIVRYRGKPICHDCVLDLHMICVDLYRDDIKRFISNTIKLTEYGER